MTCTTLGWETSGSHKPHDQFPSRHENLILSCHAPVRRHSWTVRLVSAVVALQGFVVAAAEPGPRLLEAKHGVVCLLTVCSQKAAKGKKCSLLWSK